MSVVINGITHELFHGIDMGDSTGCGMAVRVDDLRGIEDTDCMACVAHEAEDRTVWFAYPGRVGWFGKP